MPRLSPSFLLQARSRNKLLPILLRECRDLESAQNELRWLREHAFECHGLPTRLPGTQDASKSFGMSPWNPVWRTLERYVRRRARSEPLQYILGTQPFGELEILCRQNTLIPRPETETYTRLLASLVKDSFRNANRDSRPLDKLRILDLCTGTGCISLLLHSLLKGNLFTSCHEGTSNGRDASVELEVIGADISEAALKLARNNLRHNVEKGYLDPSAKTDISFRHFNVLDFKNFNTCGENNLKKQLGLGNDAMFDVLVSNPPYVPPKAYRAPGGIGRSVRLFEPKLALVGQDTFSARDLNHSACHQGDDFYLPLLRIAKFVKAKVVILEVSDAHQAKRVKELAEGLDLISGAADHTFVAAEWDDDGQVVTDQGHIRAGDESKKCRSPVRTVVLTREGWGLAGKRDIL